jgi:Ca2+-dependent lipid-binding protein
MKINRFTNRLSKPPTLPMAPPTLPAATYKIYATVHKATNLVGSDKDGFSDPYVVLQLEGDKDLPRVRTSGKDNDLNPEYNEDLDPLDGYFISNDQLKIQVWDRDGTSGKDDDVIGAIDFPVRDLRPGQVVEHDLTLRTTDKKGKYHRSKTRSDAGHLFIRIHIAGLTDDRYIPSNFTVDFFKATVEFLSASTLPTLESGDPNPFVRGALKLPVNTQSQDTKHPGNTLSPQWNETKTYYLASPTETLSVALYHYDKAKGAKPEKLATLHVHFSDFTVGAEKVDGEV